MFIKFKEVVGNVVKIVPLFVVSLLVLIKVDGILFWFVIKAVVRIEGILLAIVDWIVIGIVVGILFIIVVNVVVGMVVRILFTIVVNVVVGIVVGIYLQ